MQSDGIHEKTLVLLKPDAVRRGIVGAVTARFEQRGLKLVACKMITPSAKLWREHYAHIADKPFYPDYEKFMMSAPVVAMVWEGLDAVKVVCAMTGVTNARDAASGTIRGDYSISKACNVIHRSDSLDTAKIEVSRFFKEDELFDYDRSDALLYMDDERT